METVSIIIPCFNDAKYIEQSVQSALDQTYSNTEVIVIDDGSNSETKEVLNKIAPRISKLITQENKGQSTARNVGIKAAKGTYILVLDSDDYFEPSFCEKAIDVFVKQKETKVVSCYANLLFEDGSSSIYKPSGGTINDFLYVNNALGTAMFKKEDWGSSGGYDEDMRNGFEDWEFFIRLLKNGGNITILKEPLYTYRKRNDSTTHRANKVKFDILKYIYLKHKDLYIHNYDATISYFIKEMKKLQVSVENKNNSVDAKIGQLILAPFRFFKKRYK